MHVGTYLCHAVAGGRTIEDLDNGGQSPGNDH